MTNRIAGRSEMNHGDIPNASKSIRNCNFKYRCHMEWDDLEQTEKELVRHCGICSKLVYLCQNEAELASAIVGNLCVAIPASMLGEYTAQSVSPLVAGRDSPTTLVGDISIG
jgi:hypothetical protein